MDFQGKVALITGGASGIGAATARRLAELGGIVVIVDVDDARGEGLVAELGAGHRYRHLDVAELDGWRALLSELEDDVGPVDIFHLNAGIMSRPSGAPALDDPIASAFTEAAYRRVMAVNVDGVVLGILAALPHLEDRRADIVVTVSALNGAAPDPIYGLSKIALVGLVWGLAPTLAARSVRLNAICPGVTDTSIVAPDIHQLVGDAINPPSYVANAVVAILESDSTGVVWYAPGPSLGLWRVAPPALPMAGHPGSSGLRRWEVVPAPSSPAARVPS